MAINLNPGADASLVAQSYRMGMAGVPKDLSETFEAMADSYSTAIGKVGAAAKSVATVVGKVAGAAALEAIDIQRQWDKGAAMQSAGTIDFGTSEIETIKNELKDARGKAPGQERRIAVANAKKKRDDFFAIVKNSEEDAALIVSRLAEKNYDEKATGAKDIAMAQAISLRGEPIKSGPYKGMYAVIGKNEDGEIEWSFDGDVEYGYTDEKFKEEFPGTVNARDVSSLLKGDADPAKVAIQEVGVGEINAGRQGQLSLPNDVMRRVSETVTEETLPSLLHKEIGNSGKSFMEALETPSALSKDIWKELSVLGNVDGYTDIDGDGKVSAGDFADKEGENYKILISTFDPTHENYSYEATKDAFVEETSATILTDNQNAYNDWEKKNRKKGSGSPSTKTDDLGIPDWSYVPVGDSDENLDWSSARTIKSNLLKGKAFKYEGEWYDYVNGSWHQGYEDEDNPGVEIGSADDMVTRVIDTNHGAFQNLETKKIKVKSVEGETEQEVFDASVLKAISSKADDGSVANNLNTLFNISLSEDYDGLVFKPAPARLRLSKTGEDRLSDKVALWNPYTEEWYRENGNILKFKTGEDATETQLEKIKKILGRAATADLPKGEGSKTKIEW
tara:strand:- start:1111 stop:2970 length:1860 start_codon:yes stop_codon:yes gene_type:complete